MSSLREDLDRLAIPEQPTLSEDGQRVAFVLHTVDRNTDSYRRAIHVLDATGDSSTRWTDGPHDDSPIWMLNDRVRFLRRGEDHITLCEVSVPQQVRIIGDIPSSAVLVRWSPDGRRLAFVNAIGNDKWAVLVWNDMGDTRIIATLRTPVFDLTWSPTCTDVAVVVPYGDRSELTDVTVVKTVDVRGDTQPHLASGTSGHVTSAGFTNSGNVVALGRADTTVGYSYVMPHSTNKKVGSSNAVGNIREAVPGCQSFDLIVAVRVGSTTRLRAVQLSSGEHKDLTPGTLDVIEFSRPSRSGVVAAVVRTAATVGEIVLVDVGTSTLRELGFRNRAHSTIQRSARSWTTAQGRRIEGWLVRDERRTLPGPLLVDFHGGPHTTWTGTLEQAHLHHDALARRGWTIVLPNLSGSDGYGEEHLQRVLGRWGVPDSAEAWSIIDQLVEEGIADPSRLAVCGYSYGGFLANTMVVQDSRLAAAVVGNAPADLAAMVTESVLGDFITLSEIGAHPSNAPELYAELSPLTHAKRVCTPVLVMQASDDEVVPAGQARFWHERMLARGVPSEYVAFDGADHEFLYAGRPSQRSEYYQRLVDWLERFVSSPPATTQERT